MKHDLIKTGDPDAFPAIKDRNGEVVLNYCRLCHQAEGELQPSCPGTVVRRAWGTHKAEALAIYVVMARDPSDAMDMISECSDVEVIETLHAMLMAKGGANTDHELNELMVGPTKRRLDELKEAARSSRAR